MPRPVLFDEESLVVVTASRVGYPKEVHRWGVGQSLGALEQWCPRAVHTLTLPAGLGVCCPSPFKPLLPPTPFAGPLWWASLMLM